MQGKKQKISMILNENKKQAKLAQELQVVHRCRSQMTGSSREEVCCMKIQRWKYVYSWIRTHIQHDGKTPDQPHQPTPHSLTVQISWSSSVIKGQTSSNAAITNNVASCTHTYYAVFVCMCLVRHSYCTGSHSPV